MGNFAGALPSEEQHFQSCAGEVRFAERAPERWHFGIAQHAVSTHRFVALYAATWVERQKLLAGRPCEDGARACQDLVRQYRAVDLAEHGADISARYRGGVQLSPHGKHIAADQGISLPPTLILSLGVFLDVARSECAKGGRLPSCASLRSGVRAIARHGKHKLRRLRARVRQAEHLGVAQMEPPGASSKAIDELV
jgi:hypothetical protein